MGDKVELPGDHWAILKDPMEISRSQAKSLNHRYIDLSKELKGPKPPVGSEAIAVVDPTAPPPEPEIDGDQMEKIEDFEDELVAYFVEKWDFDVKPSARAMADIPAPVYNALKELTDDLVGDLIPALKKKAEGDSPTTP